MKILLNILILLSIQLSSHGQGMIVEKYFEWYSPHYIIYNPSFSHTGTEIIFSKQFYIPDGGDAIGREKYVQSLLIKAKTIKRFADPVVSILDLKTKKLTTVDYGWTPSFSNDDSLILYTFQTAPISGYRVLASTTQGNRIQLYNRIKKTYEVLARPLKGFLSDPKFLDSSNVSYLLGAAVNGAYGGGAGLNIINLLTKKTDSVVKIKPKFGNFSLLGLVENYNNNIGYTICEPQDSFTYRYRFCTKAGINIDFGDGYMKDLESKVAIDEQNDILYLDDERILVSDTSFLIKYSQNKQVSKRPLLFTYSEAYLSPNGKYMIYREDETKVYIINLQSSEKVKLALPGREIHGVSWSADIKQFAIVQDHEGLPDTDKISLFKIR